MDATETKEFKYSKAGILITLCYFQNTSPSGIQNLVHYRAVKNIMAGVHSINPGINLQWVPTPSHILSEWKISTYNKKQHIIQLLNKKHGKYDPSNII